MQNKYGWALLNQVHLLAGLALFAFRAVNVKRVSFREKLKTLGEGHRLLYLILHFAD